MAAQDIEYVELYTSDERSTVEYFVSSFGFTRIAESGGDGAIRRCCGRGLLS